MQLDPAAIRDLEEALSVHRELGYRLGQTHALTHLGDVRRLTGTIRAQGVTWSRRWAYCATSATHTAKSRPST